MSSQGYLPCFSEYKHSDFPVSECYKQDSHIEKIKRLVAAFLDTPNPINLCNSIGNHDIQPIRPDSQEGKRLIKQFGFPGYLYRIDYGNTPFRIVFALRNMDRTALILAADTNHVTFSGKHRK